jgi:hypothetical protein
MPRVLPSHVVAAIDNLFGVNRNELDGGAVRHVYRAEVHTLLGMLDEVPRELIDLNVRDYLELSQCRAVLATVLSAWNLGDIAPARDVAGKDVVVCIRRLMAQCHDDVPPAEPELLFILDVDLRLTIEGRIRAAWTDFKAREWMGATVFAGAALEALLLWSLKQRQHHPLPKRPLDELHLADLIKLARAMGVIDAATQEQAALAKDARNLIHPGRAQRAGEECSKSSALTALAAVYRVVDALNVPLL